jgi:hypothetical protein
MKLLLALLPLFLSPAVLPTAEELVERSTAHHDPRGVWESRAVEITAEVQLAERLATERGYAARTDRVRIHEAAGEFHYRSQKGADVIEIFGDGVAFNAKLNGSTEISAADREKHGLGAGRLVRWRDYFGYMFGMPMKLSDPGTKLDPDVDRVEFAGREVLALRVTYSPEVGGDVWYFYFDPQSYALVGCRFYHDEAQNDGEYIVFEGEISGGGLTLPKRRLWHMNRDGEFIASDEIVSIR